MAILPRIPRPRPALPLLLLCTLAACSGDQAPSEGSAGSTVRSLDPDWIIGQVEGAEAYTFGDVRSVAVDDGGRTYVGDRIGAKVRAYAEDGSFVAEVAAEGQGPGELYGWPADLALGPDGALYVRDGRGVTIFRPSGGEGVADSLVDVWTWPGYGNLTETPGRVSSDGTYLYPNGSFVPGERPRVFYTRFRDGKVSGDTLEVPPLDGLSTRRTAFYRLSETGGRMVDGLSHVPFAAMPAWTVTVDGTVLAARGDGVTVVETGLAGDTLRQLTVGAMQARPVPEAERADSLRALEARIDSLPVRLDEVVNLGPGVAERRLPDVLPEIVSLRAGGGGLLWVERWPPEGAGDSRYYDVYDAEGAFRGSLELRAPLLAEPGPYFGRHHVVGVVRDPATGIHRVVRFSHGLG